MYRDRDFGFLQGVVSLASSKHPAYVQVDKVLNVDGSMSIRRKKIEILGSLQAFKSKRIYNQDGSVASTIRVGKFFAEYDVKLSDGDIIQKENEFFIVTDVSDYDFAGVRNYEVTRLGIDEIHSYDFFDLIAKPFSESEEEEIEDDI